VVCGIDLAFGDLECGWSVWGLLGLGGIYFSFLELLNQQINFTRIVSPKKKNNYLTQQNQDKITLYLHHKFNQKMKKIKLISIILASTLASCGGGSGGEKSGAQVSNGSQTTSCTTKLGKIWEAIPNPSKNQPFFFLDIPEGAIFVQGKFIAYSSREAFESFDGLQWSKIPNYPRGAHALTFGANKYLALGHYNTYFISSDGKNWESYKLNPPLFFNSIGSPNILSFGNGKFIAVSGESIITSSDGVNWTKIASPAESLWPQSSLRSVSFLNNKFYVWGKGFNQVLVSQDGNNWQTLTMKGDMNLLSTSIFDIAYINGNYIILSGSGAVGFSQDGINWTTILQSNPLRDNPVTTVIGKSKEMLMIPGMEKGIFGIYSSCDGYNWSFSKEEDLSKSFNNIIAISENIAVKFGYIAKYSKQ
jgi:hypothetical protein